MVCEPNTDKNKSKTISNIVKQEQVIVPNNKYY